MNKPARFEFGGNWKDYVAYIGEGRTVAAERSLETMLGANALKGVTVADAGCGSGLFSLAALRLGAARVVSFDYAAAPPLKAAAVEYG